MIELPITPDSQEKTLLLDLKTLRDDLSALQQKLLANSAKAAT